MRFYLYKSRVRVHFILWCENHWFHWNHDNKRRRQKKLVEFRSVRNVKTIERHFIAAFHTLVRTQNESNRRRLLFWVHSPTHHNKITMYRLWQSLILIFVCHKIVEWFNQRNQLRVITFKYAFTTNLTIIITKSRELISANAPKVTTTTTRQRKHPRPWAWHTAKVFHS